MLNKIRYLAILNFFVLILLSLCISCQPITSNNKAALINYDYSFYFENIDSLKSSNVKLIDKYKDQYEFISMPVDWNNTDGTKFNLRVFHANPDFKKVKKIFLFAIGGPGEPLDEEFAIKINKALGDDWDFIVFDHRGAALSAYTVDKKRIDLKYLTISQSVEDIHSLVTDIKKGDVKALIVGGDSAGAILSLQYAVKYSDEIDMLYIDGGAPSAEFINISNRKTLDMITEKLKPLNIGEIADYYNVNHDLMFETLMNFGAEDPGLKQDFWNDFKNKNSNAEKMLKDYFEANVLVPPFEEENKLINAIVTTQRLYYTIGCMDYLPEKQDISSLYTFLKSYNDMSKIFADKYNLRRNPFNYKEQLGKIKTDTIITDGLDDYIIPFQNSIDIYKLMDNTNAVLFGVKDTAHVVIITDQYEFIAELINKYIETKSLSEVKKFITKNKKAVLY